MRSVSQAQDKAEDVADDVADHPVVQWGARVGFAASALIHVLVAWLGLRVAWQSYDGGADQSGALALLVENLPGLILLVVIAAGLSLLALWNLAESFAYPTWSKRAKPLGKAVAYGAIAATAFKFVLNHRPSQDNPTRDLTATLLSHPAGMVLVILIGLGVLAIGGYHVYKGVTKKFLGDLRQNPGQVAEVSGMIGYAAKGVALALVGTGFLAAGWDHQADKASGLDGALKTLLQWPFGPWILSVVAIGFGVYGIYSAFRAKYAKI